MFFIINNKKFGDAMCEFNNLNELKKKIGISKDRDKYK